VCCYAPEAVYEHVWLNGDLIVCDNLATQHARGAIVNVGVRRLQRAVVAESRFYDQYPQFLARELS
jgi:alpha-ketoglutarate-dependent taurine dioxygenase